MNKIFKNFLLLLIISILIIPQITFAFWWNPFSWRIFDFLRKQETKQEQVIDKQTVIPSEFSTVTQEENPDEKKKIEEFTQIELNKKTEANRLMDIEKKRKLELEIQQRKIKEDQEAKMLTDLQNLQTQKQETQSLIRSLTQKVEYCGQVASEAYKNQSINTCDDPTYDESQKAFCGLVMGGLRTSYSTFFSDCMGTSTPEDRERIRLEGRLRELEDRQRGLEDKIQEREVQDRLDCGVNGGMYANGNCTYI